MPNDAGFVDIRPDIVEAALSGLLTHPKTLPARLFYDAEGCRLFYEITKLPEYYLTRTEMRLLASLGASLLPDAMVDATLVEFGGSEETKALHLLDLPGQRFSRYLSIDVAQDALDAMRCRLAVSHPHLRTDTRVADFMHPLNLPDGPGPRLGFFPGSTIGNLTPDEAVMFLHQARLSLGGDCWFLLGADLRKSPDILLPAYNDSAGVTAAFNLNLLRRLNREASADFDLRAFRHQAIWNDTESRIEMHLVSCANQSVQVGGRKLLIDAGETIHTENSYKYTPETIMRLSRSAGWALSGTWSDENKMFGLFLLRGR